MSIEIGSQTYFGGPLEIGKMVRVRLEAGESLADPSCANWWFWTILIKLGVSRVQE